LRYILLIQTEETFSINTHRFYWFRGAQNFLSSCKTPLQPHTISIASLISSATAHLFFHYCCLFFAIISMLTLLCASRAAVCREGSSYFCLHHITRVVLYCNVSTPTL
jgi:hypothetical protein